MDRGVKIAIFVASVVSLGLGLVWDQVLSHARSVVETELAGEMDPERIEAIVGPPHIQRAPPTEEFEPIPAPAAADPQPTKPTPEPNPESGWTEYVVQPNDGWWLIANRRFKSRGLTSTEIADANIGKRLRPGVVIKIPPARK